MDRVDTFEQGRQIGISQMEQLIIELMSLKDEKDKIIGNIIPVEVIIDIKIKIDQLKNRLKNLTIT